MKRKFLTLLLFSTLMICGASAQSKAKTFADRITIKGYGQAGYSAKFEDKIGNSNSFNINKVEVLALGKINHRWDMGITFQLHGKPMLKDLFTRFTLAPELSIRVGQFKTPLGLENNLAPFMNSLINGGSYTTTYFAGVAGNPHYFGTSGRDMGLEISGDLLNKLLSYKAVVMNGTGMNNLSHVNPKMFGGSLHIRPLKMLTLHTSYIGGKLPSMSQATTLERHRASAGFQLDCREVSVMGEYMWGKDGEQTGRGAYLTSAIHLPKRWDLVLGADYVNANLDLPEAKDVFTATLGVTQWFYGLCRWQVEYQFRAPRNEATLLDIRSQGHKVAAQLQFVF